MLSFNFLDTPTDDQIRQMIDLYRQEGWWGAKADDEALLRRLVAGSHCFLVVQEGPTLVAMGRAISDRVSDAYIQDVVVATPYKGRGIGTRVVERLAARLRADGLGWIGLIAERGSHHFYERLGFKAMPDATAMLKMES